MKAFTHWIPPVPLALGQLSFALSWVLLWLCGAHGALGPGFLAFAWIHAVALGWITVVALAVLMHVIPGFTDVEWRMEPLARTALVVFALAAALLIGGFIAQNATLLSVAGVGIALSLTAYCTAALSTLAQTRTAERATRAIGRALSVTLIFLLIAGLLGAAFTLAFRGFAPAALLVRGPAVHAVLAISGWLTVLTAGVSARTMRPICGLKSRYPKLHIFSGSGLWAGTVLAALGLLSGASWFALAGFAVLAAGVIVYAFDILDIVAHATVAHRPPQFLMASGVIFAVLSAAFAILSAYGAPLASAAVVASLLGWAGSAVLAHLHHLGVRVIITFVRGDDDPTRPWMVLHPLLTWTSALAYVLAAVCATAGVAFQTGTLVQLGALLGAISWCSLAANIAGAPARLARLPLVLPTLRNP